MIKRFFIQLIFTKYEIEIIKHSLFNHKQLIYKNQKTFVIVNLLYNFFEKTHNNKKR
jgi:hypothetical protein